MFGVLKDKLSTSPILKFPDFTKPFEVHTNASGFAIGGVSMQEEHPFAFENKKLVRAQLRWPTHEKELFAMVSCFKCWQHYLGSHKTKVFTNNVSLRYFKMQPKATGKQL
jgi:hypothetical protein